MIISIGWRGECSTAECVCTICSISSVSDIKVGGPASQGLEKVDKSGSCLQYWQRNSQKVRTECLWSLHPQQQERLHYSHVWSQHWPGDCKIKIINIYWLTRQSLHVCESSVTFIQLWHQSKCCAPQSFKSPNDFLHSTGIVALRYWKITLLYMQTVMVIFVCSALIVDTSEIVMKTTKNKINSEVFILNRVPPDRLSIKIFNQMELKHICQLSSFHGQHSWCTTVFQSSINFIFKFESFSVAVWLLILKEVDIQYVPLHVVHHLADIFTRDWRTQIEQKVSKEVQHNNNDCYQGISWWTYFCRSISNSGHWTPSAVCQHLQARIFGLADYDFLCRRDDPAWDQVCVPPEEERTTFANANDIAWIASMYLQDTGDRCGPQVEKIINK